MKILAEAVAAEMSREPILIASKYKAYCSHCQYTIWQNEQISYDGKACHRDCIAALRDKTPRVLNPRYVAMLGRVNKRRLIARLEG